MTQLRIDWDKAPDWAKWAARDADGDDFVYASRPERGSAGWFPVGPDRRCSCVTSQGDSDRDWRDTLTQRPQTVTSHQDNDDAGMLRAQIGHLLEDMTAEQLDALYVHVRKALNAAQFDELNRQLDKPFGEVPREWQLKALEAFLDGHSVLSLSASGMHYTGAYPTWARGERYRIEPKQS